MTKKQKNCLAILKQAAEVAYNISLWSEYEDDHQVLGNAYEALGKLQKQLVAEMQRVNY